MAKEDLKKVKENETRGQMQGIDRRARNTMQ